MEKKEAVVTFQQTGRGEREGDSKSNLGGAERGLERLSEETYLFPLPTCHLRIFCMCINFTLLSYAWMQTPVNS